MNENVIPLPTSKAAKIMYLGREHFMKMLAFAAAVHVVAGILWWLSPGLTVNKIPVRVLNIKLGTGELVAVETGPMRSTAVSGRMASQPAPVKPPVENARSKTETVSKPKAIDKSAPKEKVKATARAAAPVAGKVQQGNRQHAAVQESDNTAAHEARLPSQYVRELGDPKGSGAGSAVGTSAEEAAEITKRYGQVISLWLQKHKVYPAEAKRAGTQGTALIRIRLNRSGQILSFKLEKSTGSTILDDAVLDMVRASNPVPAAPDNYPSPNLIEFLVPVSYKLR